MVYEEVKKFDDEEKGKKNQTRGRLAQLVERYPYKVDVTGSSPVMPTMFYPLFYESDPFV